jgi:sigma-B regulation protein RsbU (phosphoserine phosphatase)
MQLCLGLIIFIISILGLIIGYLHLENKSKQKTIHKQQHNLKEIQTQHQSNLAQAKMIHYNSLPDNLPQKNNLAVAAFYQPAEDLGGDYYNIFKIDHGAMDIFFEQYFVYMFDVSGHGIASAMLSTFINNTIEDYFSLYHNQGEEIVPKQILGYINKHYRAENYPDDYLICLLGGILDLNNYEFTYSSAGFQFPFYKINNTGTLTKLKAGGLPISSAIDNSLFELEEITISFAENEIIFCTTDGLLEQVINSNRYNEKLESRLKNIDYLHPSFLIESVKQDFINFNGSQSGDDDITCLAIGRPNGDLEKWQLKTEDDNFELTKKEITNYLAGLNSNTDFFQPLINLGLEKSNQLSVIILASNNYLMFVLNTSKTNLNWIEIINNNPNLSQLKQESISFFCPNETNTKLYIFKSLI